MSNRRYSAGLIVTARDFAQCNWKNALAEEGLEGYPSMRQTFYRPLAKPRKAITHHTKGIVVAFGCLLHDAFAETRVSRSTS